MALTSHPTPIKMLTGLKATIGNVYSDGSVSANELALTHDTRQVFVKGSTQMETIVPDINAANIDRTAVSTIKASPSTYFVLVQNGTNSYFRMSVGDIATATAIAEDYVKTQSGGTAGFLDTKITTNAESSPAVTAPLTRSITNTAMNISLPLASTSIVGGVKVLTNGLAIDTAGVLSLVGATSAVIGGVTPSVTDFTMSGASTLNLSSNVVKYAISGTFSTLQYLNASVATITNDVNSKIIPTREYVDSKIATLSGGLFPAGSVTRCLYAIKATIEGAGFLTGLKSIDGAVVTAGDLVLVVASDIASVTAGIWIANAGAWTRPAVGSIFSIYNASTNNITIAGALVTVQDGTAYTGTTWVCADGAKTGTDALNWIVTSVPSVTVSPLKGVDYLGVVTARNTGTSSNVAYNFSLQANTTQFAKNSITGELEIIAIDGGTW